MKVSMMFTLAVPLAVALMAAPALAHGPHGGGACRPLVQALCPSVTPGPGPGGYGSCLKSLCPNLTGPGGFASCLLSQGQIAAYPACQAQLTNMQNKIAAWQSAFTNACANDVSQLCSNVTTGPRGQIQCLRQAVKNNQQVSATCQTFLAKRHGHRHHGHPGHGATTDSSSNQLVRAQLEVGPLSGRPRHDRAGVIRVPKGVNPAASSFITL
jgi:hypothetical protein